MLSAVTLVCSLLTALHPAPAPPSPLTTGTNCDGFGYVCGRTVPLCGCGCLPGTDACMKDAKDGGLIAACVDSSGQPGYCAR